MSQLQNHHVFTDDGSILLALVVLGEKRLCAEHLVLLQNLGKRFDHMASDSYRNIVKFSR